MQPSEEPRNSAINEHFDPLTHTSFGIRGNRLVVKEKGNNEKVYPLPQPYNGEAQKHLQTLRFKRSFNSQVVFNPSGKSFTCKSDKLQDVEMNFGFSEGVAIWTISSISNCLSLVCGVRNIENKVEHFLDFTIHNSATITFKLDIGEKKLKAWISKCLTVVEK